MTTREHFIFQIENAANNIASVPKNELAVLLRRAAIRLRNLPDPVDMGVEYEYLMDETGRSGEKR